MKVKNDNKFIFLGVIAVIVLAIVAIRIAVANRKVDLSKLSDEEIAVYMDEKMENIAKKDLSQMGERDRMEYYVSEFIESIEEGKYSDAYDMLYDEFKKNYFPTYEKFEEYAKTKFPRLASIQHENFERNGDVYVLWTKFSDSLGSKDSYKEIKFVVQENDLHDFKMSFSVEL